jgi:hypothetical protein
MQGVGSTMNMKVAILESVHFSIGGFPVILKPANVLLSPAGEASRFFHGNLGIDLLQQAHQATFDFRTMTLSLQ